MHFFYGLRKLIVFFFALAAVFYFLLFSCTIFLCTRTLICVFFRDNSGYLTDYAMPFYVMLFLSFSGTCGIFWIKYNVNFDCLVFLLWIRRPTRSLVWISAILLIETFFSRFQLRNLGQRRRNSVNWTNGQFWIRYVDYESRRLQKMASTFARVFLVPLLSKPASPSINMARAQCLRLSTTAARK